MFLRVAEFHRAFGHLINDTPVLPDESVRRLRTSLIREELGEFCEAYQNDDRVEMADALADLLYVLAGTAVAYGFAPDEPVQSPYEGRDPIEDTTGSYAEYLKEDFERYEAAETANDLAAIQSAVFHMMVEVFGIARQLRMPINEIFTEVHASNMSKLDENGQAIRREDGKILKSHLFRPPAIAAILERWDNNV